MMKILITGSTGFIGKHVVNAFLQHCECEIIVSGSNIERLKKSFLEIPVQIIPFDIYQRNEGNVNLYEFFNRPDKIVHLAWKGLPNYGKSFHMEENLSYEISFLFNLIENGANDITVTGTCFEYGMCEGKMSEDMPSAPTNFYSLAKDCLRKTLEIYQKQNYFDFKWVRLFYSYGFGQHSNSIIPQLERAVMQSDAIFNMSGGMQVRDYLKVETVASNLVAIALQNETTGIINNCSGKPVYLIDFIKNYITEKNLNIKLNPGYYPYLDYEPMSFWGDVQKLQSILKHFDSEERNSSKLIK